MAVRDVGRGIAAGTRERPGLALEIAEHPVAALAANLRHRAAEHLLVVHGLTSAAALRATRTTTVSSTLPRATCGRKPGAAIRYHGIPADDAALRTGARRRGVRAITDGPP
jgi:hypothetical protein